MLGKWAFKWGKVKQELLPNSGKASFWVLVVWLGRWKVPLEPPLPFLEMEHMSAKHALYTELYPQPKSSF